MSLVKKHIIDGISNNFEQTPPFIPGIAEEYFYDKEDKLIKHIRCN